MFFCFLGDARNLEMYSAVVSVITDTEFALRNSMEAATNRVTRNGSKPLIQKYGVNFKNVSTPEQMWLYGSLFLVRCFSPVCWLASLNTKGK